MKIQYDKNGFSEKSASYNYPDEHCHIYSFSLCSWPYSSMLFSGLETVAVGSSLSKWLHLFLNLAKVPLSDGGHLGGFTAAGAYILKEAEVGTPTYNHSDDNNDYGTKSWWDWILKHRMNAASMWWSLRGHLCIWPVCTVSWRIEKDESCLKKHSITLSKAFQEQ